MFSYGEILMLGIAAVALIGARSAPLPAVSALPPCPCRGSLAHPLSPHPPSTRPPTGPADLPVIARVAGRFSGRAVGFLLRLRARASAVAQEAELAELHAELRQSMAQLVAVREEIRAGVNMTAPGCVSRGRGRRERGTERGARMPVDEGS